MTALLNHINRIQTINKKGKNNVRQKTINNILAQYDGVTGAAQIIPAPRNIKVTNTPDV